MRLSDLEDQIASTQAEILSLQLKLIYLRRQRNTLIPLYALPAELIVRILQILADDTAATIIANATKGSGDISFGTFPWKSATQFCAYWRALALGCSSLWTTIVTTKLRWFDILMERSRDSLLHIVVYPGSADTDDSTRMYQSIADNMHRVHSLLIRPVLFTSMLSQLRNVSAPELTTLCFSGRQNMRCDTLRPFNPANANVMPKLSQLEVVACSNFDWNILLPAHLPTVTKLVLRSLDIRDQLNVLRRCTAVRHLSISRTGSRGEVVRQNAPVNLPDLQHLHFSILASKPFVQMQFPFVKKIYLTLAIESVATEAVNQALRIIPRFLEPFANSMDTNTRIDSLTIACHPHVVLRAINNDERTLVQVKVRDTCINARAYFNGLAQLSQSMNVSVGAIFMRGERGMGLEALFNSFQDQSDVKKIALWNECALIDFLSYSQVCESNPGSSAEPCNCVQCHDMRLKSFPGLKVLRLEGMNEKLVTEYNGVNWLEVLLQWIEARMEYGVGPGLVSIEMVRSDGYPGQAAIDGLAQVVPNLELTVAEGVGELEV